MSESIKGFTVVSTFAGCGGSSLGYKMAGGEVRLAVEFDPHAVQTYRLNHPETDLFAGDIATLSAERALELARLKPGDLDIFDGSPPCQGFSTSGKRQFSDRRNSLFREYVRLLKAFQPRACVMENVSGLVKGQMKIIFAEMFRELEAAGYSVKAQLLNAMNFGVPQSRPRVIFIGIRNDLGLTPSFPKASPNLVSVRTALRDVATDEEVFLRDRAAEIYPHIDRGGAGDKPHKRMFGKPNFFNLKRLSWDRPSNTVMKMVAAGNFGGGLAHPDIPRLLTIAELKRICSFPDSFQIPGTFEERWARLGNSVPPLLMKAIAEHVRSITSRL